MSVFTDNLPAKKRSIIFLKQTKRTPGDYTLLGCKDLFQWIRGAAGTQHQRVGFERLNLNVELVSSFLFHPISSLICLTFINPSFPIFCAQTTKSSRVGPGKKRKGRNVAGILCRRQENKSHVAVLVSCYGFIIVAAVVVLGFGTLFLLFVLLFRQRISRHSSETLRERCLT